MKSRSPSRPLGPVRTAVPNNDADIIWIYDMVDEVDVHPHDSPHSSVLVDGRFLYVNTNNGLDSKHEGIPKPDAPSLIALDKKTGRLTVKETVDNKSEMVRVQGKRTMPWAWKLQGAISEVKVLIGTEAAVRGEQDGHVLDDSLLDGDSNPVLLQQFA